MVGTQLKQLLTMFASVSRYLAHCHKGVDYQLVKNHNISSLSTVKDNFFPCCIKQCTPARITSRQQCLHTKSGNKKQPQNAAILYTSTFGREQCCHYSGNDVVHLDDGRSSMREIKLKANHTRDENEQKLKENDGELCKQTDESLFYNNNIYLSEPWTSSEPESIVEFQSKSENGGQPYDIFSKDFIQFHGVEEVSPLYGSNPNVFMEATNQFSLKHMPDFRQVTEIYYTVTRRKLLGKKVASLYRNNNYIGAHGAAQKLLRYGHSLMYCCPAEVFSCMQILKKSGVPPQQLVKNLDLLVQPSVVLKAREQLVHDLGLYSSTPIVCLSRLEDLMTVPETELIEHNFLPDDSSLLSRLLSKLGSGHVLEEQQLRHQLSQTNTMKETYNKILAGLLAQRFSVSVSSVESLLQRYQPSYKPLSHYYLIADIIDKHLRLNFEQVCQQPALLDLSPQDTLALLQQRFLVAGHPTVKALCVCPDLGRIPHSLLQRWLRLLDAHCVLQFPIDGVVPWVLKQDLLVIAKLVLDFLVHHPQWQNIKSSYFLFEIFANPSVMNDLMKDVPATGRDGSSSKTLSVAHRPLTEEVVCATSAAIPVAAEELEAWEEGFESEAAAVGGVGEDYGVSRATSPRWDNGNEDGDGGEHQEARDDTDDEGDTIDNGTQGSLLARTGVIVEPAMDGTRASSSSADRHFQVLPADQLDVSDKYIACYTPGNNDLTFCSKKNRPSAEVNSYLQTQLKIDAAEVNRVGRHGAAPCSLLDAIAKLQLLLQHGYSKQQIAAAVEIFGYDEDLISRELSLMMHRYTNYEEYWRRHPNVVNLLLYYVTKVTKNTVCDENLE